MQGSYGWGNVMIRNEFDKGVEMRKLARIMAELKRGEL